MSQGSPTTPSRWGAWGDGGRASGRPACGRAEFAGRPGSATVLKARRPGRRARPGRLRARGRGSVVEHHLAKVRVAGSNPVVRSEWPEVISGWPRAIRGGMAEWFRQGPAKPCTRVRFPLPPRGRLAQRESASLTRKRSLVQSQYRPPGGGHTSPRFMVTSGSDIFLTGLAGAARAGFWLPGLRWRALRIGAGHGGTVLAVLVVNGCGSDPSVSRARWLTGSD